MRFVPIEQILESDAAKIYILDPLRHYLNYLPSLPLLASMKIIIGNYGKMTLIGNRMALIL